MKKKKENGKREGGKLKMEGGKSLKMRGPFVFIFYFYLFIYLFILLFFFVLFFFVFIFLFFYFLIFFFFFFFFFCFSLFKTKMCFGATKMEIFYREKAFHTGKNIKKNMTLPPQKNFPVTPLDVSDETSSRRTFWERLLRKSEIHA